MELAAAVVSLSCKAVIIANDLYELHSKYKDAGPTIEAICHEVEVVRASLSRVQRLLENDSPKGVESNDDLRDVFDTAMTGCTVVLSCLDEEIKKLLAGSNQGSGGGLGWKAKAKYLWKEETMMDLLQKLRGQQGAISLLFQSLQMESLSELHHLLREQAVEMRKSRAAADSLRQAHPDVDVPESILNDLESEVGSIISTTEFSFDDEIVNSKAYRRALSMAHQRRRPKSPELDAISETGDGGPERDLVAVTETETQTDPPTAEADSHAPPYATPTSPTLTGPPPAYEPPLPPIDTSATIISEALTSSSSAPGSISSLAATPTNTPQITAAADLDIDPLSAAMEKSFASFKLRAPNAHNHHTTIPTNRPPIPFAPRLDIGTATTPANVDDDDDDDDDDASHKDEDEEGTPSSPASDRPPSYATADVEPGQPRRATTTSSLSSTETRRHKREKALRRAQEKAVARAQKRAAEVAKRGIIRGVRPVLHKDDGEAGYGCGAVDDGQGRRLRLNKPLATLGVEELFLPPPPPPLPGLGRGVVKGCPVRRRTSGLERGRGGCGR